MATVLRNVGLDVTERLVHAQRRRGNAVATFAVLLPGLARGCSSRAYMEAVMRTCSSGVADTTLLLQFSNESKQSEGLLDFSLCSSILRDLGRHSKCSFVFAQQQFHVSAGARPCEAKPGRVQMQALSIGRAYEWSRHVLGDHRFYVRARLDDSGWCLPPLLTLPAGDAWLVVDGFDSHALALDGSRVRMFSDRYALVPARLAPVYFEAWRIWLAVDCTHPCHAGHGRVGWGASLGMHAWAPQGSRRPYEWSPWAMVGECALTTALETQLATRAFTPYRAGGGAGNALFRMRNATHVAAPSGPPIAVEEWLRRKELAGPRVHDVTAACRPDKGRPPKRPLVRPPLPKLHAWLSCQGRGVLGLCDALNVTVDGGAIVEWALLLIAASLLAARVWSSRRSPKHETTTSIEQ